MVRPRPVRMTNHPPQCFDTVARLRNDLTVSVLNSTQQCNNVDTNEIWRTVSIHREHYNNISCPWCCVLQI